MYCFQDARCLKCNSSHKVKYHCHFAWYYKANFKINPPYLKTKQGELCLYSFKCINYKSNHQVSQTSFSLYLHNQWTNFHKPSCTGKPQIRAIHTYMGCTKVTTNNWDIRPSVAVKALSANISWTAEQIHTIELALGSAHQSVSNDIWYISKQ